MQIFIKNQVQKIKEVLKTIAHEVPFIPYRKRSKRYKIWNQKDEKRFLQLIENQSAISNDLFCEIEVSIILPIFNRAFCVENAIDSILNQTHLKWKLIIVDDGSTDHLDEIIAKYADDERFEFYANQHKGVSHARNFGLERATGKYLFYLDADNMWTPNYLKNMIICMEMGNLTAAYSGVEIVGDSNEIIGFYGEEFDWTDCLELNHIDINSFCHRSDFIRDGIRFDETLKRFVDWDFILSVSRIGRVAYVPFIGVIYYDGREGDRITYTEYVGQEDIYQDIIRKKHSQYINEFQSGSIKKISWKSVLKSIDK